MEVMKQDILDLHTPALSSTSDMPSIETKPDSSPPDPVKPEVKPEPATPEEKAAPAAEEKPEEPAPSEQPDDPAAEPEPKKAKGVQKRIDELTRQREDERRRAEAAEARLDRALSALEKGSLKPQEVDDDKGPQKPAQDPNNPEASNAALEQYVLDRAEWAAERKVKATLAEDEKKRSDKEVADQTRKNQEAYRARVDKVKEKYPDYADKAEAPDVQVSIPMASAIALMEDGPEIAYYLGNDAKNGGNEAERISKLAVQLQLAELGKISAKLATPAEKPKPVSAAPAPGKPIKATSEVKRADDELSMEEYAAKRKKQWAEERRPGGVRH